MRISWGRVVIKALQKVSEDSDNQATTRNASPPRWHRSRRKFQEASYDSKNSNHLRVQASE